MAKTSSILNHIWLERFLPVTTDPKRLEFTAALDPLLSFSKCEGWNLVEGKWWEGMTVQDVIICNYRFGTRTLVFLIPSLICPNLIRLWLRGRWKYWEYCGWHPPGAGESAVSECTVLETLFLITCLASVSSSGPLGTSYFFYLNNDPIFPGNSYIFYNWIEKP